MIRYRPYDTGIRETKKCSCGRSWPKIKEIKGRTFEAIYAPSGKLINEGSVKNQVYEMIYEIKEFQILQEKDGRLVVNIVPGKKYNKKTPEKLRKKILKKSRVDFEVKTVKKISRKGSEDKKFAVYNKGKVDLA